MKLDFISINHNGINIHLNLFIYKILKFKILSNATRFINKRGRDQV
jgi:hypothetical protein